METRTLLAGRNPKWGDKRKHIQLEVKFKEIAEYGFLPFTATPDDPMPYGRYVYQCAANGLFGEIAEPDA